MGSIGLLHRSMGCLGLLNRSARFLCSLVEFAIWANLDVTPALCSNSQNKRNHVAFSESVPHDFGAPSWWIGQLVLKDKFLCRIYFSSLTSCWCWTCIWLSHGTVATLIVAQIRTALSGEFPFVQTMNSIYWGSTLTEVSKILHRLKKPPAVYSIHVTMDINRFHSFTIIQQ